MQKLSRIRNKRDSETITIQKLRFRNYRNSETITSQKLLRIRNYHDSETIQLQKLRIRLYQNSHPHGTSNCPQGTGDIRIPTPMELQMDLDCRQNPHPLWNFKLICTVKDQVISEFPPAWNFSLTWTVHKDKMIAKFPPPRNFKLT